MSGKKGLFSFFNFDSIIENLTGYVEQRIALFKIEMKEDLALGTARLFIYLILSLSLFMILLFLSIAGAVLLNKVLNSASIGFFIIAGVYLVIFAIFFFLKDASWMEKILKNKFLDIFNSLDEKNGDE